MPGSPRLTIILSLFIAGPFAIGISWMGNMQRRDSDMNVEIAMDDLDPISAQITDEYSPKTRSGFLNALPIHGKVLRWGDEIYFYVDFKAPLETGARSVMKVGELAYWPSGPALAIFFGPTPASGDDAPVAASDCNVLGIVDAPPEILRKAKEGGKITISART